MTPWKHPSDYAGFSPDGDFVLVTQHRDSDSLTRSNWERIGADLKAQAYDDGREDFANRPAVYHWRAGHWAVGWVEYLMIRGDAPANVISRGHEITAKLEAYPAYDEDHWSELEFNEACEYWAQCSVSDRVDLLKRAGQCIFAARRAELPEDADGSLFDLLRS